MWNVYSIRPRPMSTLHNHPLVSRLSLYEEHRTRIIFHFYHTETTTRPCTAKTFIFIQNICRSSKTNYLRNATYVAGTFLETYWNFAKAIKLSKCWQKRKTYTFEFTGFLILRWFGNRGGCDEFHCNCVTCVCEGEKMMWKIRFLNLPSTRTYPN